MCLHDSVHQFYIPRARFVPHLIALYRKLKTCVDSGSPRAERPEGGQTGGLDKGGDKRREFKSQAATTSTGPLKFLEVLVFIISSRQEITDPCPGALLD
jgi:hypothetical protein